MVGTKRGELVLRGGGILLQRRGPMAFQKQDYWLDGHGHLPPEKRGLWAFPHPLEDRFLNWHQLTRHMPKNLRLYPEDATPEAGENWRQAREAWTSKHQKALDPLHRFYWHGKVYSHLTVEGEVLDNDTWNLLTPKEYLKAFTRHGGLKVRKPRTEEEEAFWWPGLTWSMNFTEVFVSPRHGYMTTQAEASEPKLRRPHA